jgi:hypothetical protein
MNGPTGPSSTDKFIPTPNPKTPVPTSPKQARPAVQPNAGRPTK